MEQLQGHVANDLYAKPGRLTPVHPIGKCTITQTQACLLPPGSSPRLVTATGGSALASAHRVVVDNNGDGDCLDLAVTAELHRLTLLKDAWPSALSFRNMKQLAAQCSTPVQFRALVHKELQDPRWRAWLKLAPGAWVPTEHPVSYQHNAALDDNQVAQFLRTMKAPKEWLSTLAVQSLATVVERSVGHDVRVIMYNPDDDSLRHVLGKPSPDDVSRIEAEVRQEKVSRAASRDVTTATARRVAHKCLNRQESIGASAVTERDVVIHSRDNTHFQACPWQGDT